ncbi:MAG: DUF433 domain-containing protein [Chloroflexi bacterium]|nr:DUF433 domain-containing protein [Chloroflexota bacterium]
MKKIGKKIPSPRARSKNALALKNPVRSTKRNRLILGRYIVADSAICHGKPTFRGTRIIVWQVLEMVAEGTDWETIIAQWHSSITKEAIAEAVQLSSEAFFRHIDEFVLEPTRA